MARKRMISPAFFTSRTLNQLPIQTMVTFAGIWCWADDYGRGEDDETMVKAAVWPRRKTVTEAKVRADMDALIDADVLCQYAITGHPLVHVLSWDEFQTISHPTKSKLPPCPMHEPDAWETFQTDTDPALRKFRNGAGVLPEWLASDAGHDPERLHHSVVKGSEVQVSQVQERPRGAPPDTGQSQALDLSHPHA